MVYVIFEFCSYFGCILFCVVVLVEVKVVCVVIVMIDLNLNVCGNGISILQEVGIEVVSEVMVVEVVVLNFGFIKCMFIGKFFVCVKLGISLDGKIVF